MPWTQAEDHTRDVPGAPGLIYAGVLPRSLAWFVDGFVIALLSLVILGVLIALIVGTPEQGDTTLSTITWVGIAVIAAVYFIVFWTGRKRATPGMRLLSLQVGNVETGATLTPGPGRDSGRCARHRDLAARCRAHDRRRRGFRVVRVAARAACLDGPERPPAGHPRPDCRDRRGSAGWGNVVVLNLNASGSGVLTYLHVSGSDPADHRTLLGVRDPAAIPLPRGPDVSTVGTLDA